MPTFVNYQSFLSNFFSLAPSQVFFFVNCRRNGLLHVNFIEQYDLIIYQHLNKRTKILPLATSQIAHLCNQVNHVCTANFCHVLRALLHQNSPEIRLFLQKNAKFLSAGGSAPVPPLAGALPPDPYYPLSNGSSAPRPPKQSPPPKINFLIGSN